MIYDQLKNAHLYYGLGKKFEDSLKFLANTDFSAMPAGKHRTVIDGKDTEFRVKRYDTRLREDCKLESHDNCIDLHYIVSGKEYFCYAPVDNELDRCGENPDDDCIYYTDTANRVAVKEGMFALAFTHDAHMPELRIGNEGVPVVKAIVKIPSR